MIPTTLALLAGGIGLALLSALACLVLPAPARVGALRSPWLARAAGVVVVVAGAWTAGVVAIGLAHGIAPRRALEASIERAGPLLALALVLGALTMRVGQLRGWRARGSLLWTGLALACFAFVAHAATVSLPRTLGAPHSLHTLVVSLFLLLVETMSLGMLCVHAFYSVETIARPAAAAPRPRVASYQPKVAVHVPVYNEPSEVVLATLDSIARLRYPADRLLVLIADDSTDAAMSAAIVQACRRHGFVHHRRGHRRGFKAGALNDLDALHPPDVDAVAIVDADFVVAPEWLEETACHLSDPQVAFVQSPQAYRNADESSLARQYAAQDAYFYRAVMPARAAANSIIFCGTMGIVRLSCLREAGGWSEEHVCEDADLSLRLLANGGRAVYVEKEYGWGLAPSRFAAYKSQQRRWAFGNVRIAITRRAQLMRLNTRQRIDYVMGMLHWFDGAILAGIALALGMLGVGYAAGVDVVSHHHGELALVAMLPFLLLVESGLRLHAGMGRRSGQPLARTLAIMGLWSSIKLHHAQAALHALFERHLAFERTSKERPPPQHEGRWAQAFREARSETAFAGALLVVAAIVAARAFIAGTGAQAWLLAAWIAFYGGVFAMGPLYAYRALLPAAASATRGLPRGSLRRRRGRPTRAA